MQVTNFGNMRLAAWRVHNKRLFFKESERSQVRIGEGETGG